MLYTCVDDFFNHVEEIKKTQKPLSREEEKELAQKMKAGDYDAKKALTEAYLPILASFLKRYTRTPSLSMVYDGVMILETSINTFDFLHNNPSPNVTFVNFLSNKIRQMMIKYIADGSV